MRIRRLSIRVGIGLLSGWVFISAPSAGAQEKPAEVDAAGNGLSVVAVAEVFCRDLAAGRYADAMRPFDETMNSVMSAEKLEDLWKRLETQVGTFESFGKARTVSEGGLDFVFVPAKFKLASLNVKVVLNKKRQISGLWFLPDEGKGGLPGEFARAAYDDPEKYTELEVTVGEAPWELPGKITIPKQRMLCPVVVLVHGSGPHDEDETIGPNKPFRDLAGGLSSRGVAVLRYQKRTHAHKLRLAAEGTITVREEVIDDALAAIRLARGYQGVDGSRVFLLGHSLGASLAPQIAAEDGKLAGVILLAGTARDYGDVLLDQLAYIASLPGPTQEKNQAMYEQTRSLIERFRAGKTGEDERLLGVPLGYWEELSEAGLASLEHAKRFDGRMLIAGGGRDYQVTRKDFDVYRRALDGRKNVTFSWFADCNHLFFRGEGMATPQEYAVPGHVDRKVIEALAKWVKERS